MLRQVYKLPLSTVTERKVVPTSVRSTFGASLEHTELERKRLTELKKKHHIWRTALVRAQRKMHHNSILVDRRQEMVGRTFNSRLCTTLTHTCTHIHIQDTHLKHRLSRKHGLVACPRRQRNVDERRDEVGRLATVSGTSIVKRAHIGGGRRGVARQATGGEPRVKTGRFVHALLPVD